MADEVRPIYRDRILNKYGADNSDLPQFDITNPYLPLFNSVLQDGTHITAGQMNNHIDPANTIAFGGTRVDYDYSDRKNIWLRVYAPETPERMIYEVVRKETKTGRWSVSENVYDKVLNGDVVQNQLVQNRKMDIIKKGKKLAVGVQGGATITIDETGITGGKIGNWPLPEVGGGNGSVYFIPSTGSANAYAATSADIDEYETGMTVYITFSYANTGSATLNINGLGAKPVLTDNNVQLKSGEIRANSTHALVYDGTQFKLLSQRAILSASQLASPLTGLSRDLGAASDIASSDTILTAFARMLTMASPITGYTVGPDAPLVNTNTVRGALGRLQGQVSARAPLKTTLAAPKSDSAAPAAVTTSTSLITLIQKVWNKLEYLYDTTINVDLAAPTEDDDVPGNPSSTAITSLLQTIWNKLTYLYNKKANLASPTLTGTPTAPTAAKGTNTTQIATTAFVDALGDTKAPINVDLAAPTEDDDVPGNPSSTAITSTLQTIWNKLTYLYNKTVKISGDQTIAGKKTFSTPIAVPSKTAAATNSGTLVATEAQVYKNGKGVKSFQTGLIDVDDESNVSISISTISGADKPRTILGFIPYSVWALNEYVSETIGNLYPLILPYNGSTGSPMNDTSQDINTIYFSWDPQYNAASNSRLTGQWYVVVFN